MRWVADAAGARDARTIFCWLLVALVVGAVLALLVASAFAQPPRDVVLDQYARDVKDHRDWLESQLAAAKVSLADVQKRLDAVKPCAEVAP